ncbi:MAG: nucleoside-diphosphate kinase, partial [Brevinematales bacterium]
MELEKENAVEAFRVLIGSTDPKKAAPGTIRAKYGTGLPQNAIHASDSPENALKEIALIFG